MMKSNRRFIRKIGMFVLAACLAVLAIPGCAIDLPFGNDDEQRQRDLWNLLVLYYIDYNSNPCNFVGTPTRASALPTSSMTGRGSVEGRVLTVGGAPVVSALVILNDSNASDNVFYSSHTSVNRDGSFAIAGAPTGTYNLSIEPIDNAQFAQRIDSHIDCFQTPTSFTAGWYTGAGGMISTGWQAPSISVSSANQVVNIGTVRLSE